tara:strand:+ start:915 stop:2210 length:1296 start_codon:yes stop_codon:yes gene_type:complete
MDIPYKLAELPPIEQKYYRNISLLGKGTYGTVYLVQDTTTKKFYANKKIKYLARSRYDKTSIVNELRLLACHRCPFIINLHNAYIKDGYLNFITEYAKKGDLSKMIKKNKVKGTLFNEKTIKKYLFELCIAVEYLHKNNVIHRDIKAANVFISKSNTVKLGDVGIIKVLQPAYKYANTNIGTPYYMSPELYKHQKYNTKTDIWSVGVLLYEMMTLRPPYNAANINDLKYKISNSKWTLSNKYRAIYSADLCNLLEHILDNNQNTRYNISEILNHKYLASQYNLYNLDNTYQPINSAFYTKTFIPLTALEWKNVVKKFVNNDTLCGTINTNSSEIESKPRKKSLPPIDRKENNKAKNLGLNYRIYDSPKYCDNIKNKQYNNLDNNIVDKALSIIEDLDLLMKYISSSKFNSYYILKQDLKKRLIKMRGDLFN